MTSALRRTSFGVFATALTTQVAVAQSEGFVMTLGADTVQVEAFTKTPTGYRGMLVTRSPRSQIVHFDATVGADGRLTRYTQHHTSGDGSPAVPDPGRATMTFEGDSVIRESLDRNGAPVTHRIAAPGGTYPLGSIPIGSSFLMFELALARLRSATAADQPMLSRLAASYFQTQPSRSRLLHVQPDSIEVDYFGQGRSGFRFGDNGRLVRSDWRQSTYDVRVHRVATIDAGAVARRWSEEDARGRGAGALSPADSVTFSVGGAGLAIQYSRPAARGRVIWGGIVPSGRVWRLGANFATHLTANADVMLGATRLPAGEYTLWMLPSDGETLLIVSSSVKIFGTQYNPGKDIARIPMQRTLLADRVERLSIHWRETRLVIEWDRDSFSIPITRATP